MQEKNVEFNIQQLLACIHGCIVLNNFLLANVMLMMLRGPQKCLQWERI